MVMITDPVADLLIRIKNGYLAGKIEVTMPYSRFKESIAQVLREYEFVDDISVKEQNKKKSLTIYLRYENGKQPALKNVTQLSKPGRRMYRQHSSIPSVRGGFGILLVSTSKGVMSGEQAKKGNLGGEILAKVW